MVVTVLPSHWTARIVHDFTASPSRCTVQAPQLDVSQPTCVPVSPRSSRIAWTSRRRGSTSIVRFSPLTVRLTEWVLMPLLP
jgi:hypothetical protein